MESSDDRNPVEALAEEFMERKRQGEIVALEEYTDNYPEWADEIRELFPAMELMEDFKPASEDLSQASADSRQPHSMAHPDQVGDYRILREVGRGGMGVVYEAEQQSLGRRVALKVLPRQMAGDGRALARFQREARAAARMHHTNIVPVFEVGSADEFVFYAMQLINGQGLDQVIDDLRRLRKNTPRSTSRSGSRRSAPPAEPSVRPQPLSIAESLSMGHFRPEPLDEQGRAEALKASRQTNPAEPQEDAFEETITLQADSTNSAALPGKKDLSTAESNRKSYYLSVAEIGSQTASALSYAHDRGIIHRDIKPSNLLLDGAGTVWVVDFGLAKTGDVAMTHTGDLLGTLRYMSPERFGGMCDVRADIYSLGLTLYELLLLEPAFHSSDQLKLIDQIKQTDPKPLRSVDARIPRDLETVVLKAIDKDPRRRYQSADELADDLARFVQDQPIQARRVSAVERVARWSRRNRALAASVATVATLLILLAVGALVAAGHFRRLQQKATASAHQMAALAEEKTHLADANERLALAEKLEAENAQAQKVEAVAARQAAVEAQEELRQELYISDMREVRQAYHDGAPERLDALLRKYVPRPGQADLRGWEWFYWRRTNRRHQHQIFVGLPVFELAISPDRTWLAVQLWTGIVHVYDAKSRQRIARLESGNTHEFPQSLAISPDSRTLAAVGDEKVKLWNTDGWTEHAVLEPQGNPLAIAFSVDGRLAIAERPGAVTFWDVASGQPSGSPLETGQLVSCLAFSPDGRRLATANSTADENQAPGLLVWDVETLALDSQLVGPQRYVLALAWKRSVMAAGFADGYVRSWDGSNYEERAARSVGAPVISLALSPDGSRLAAGTSRGNSLHVWETDSRRSVTRMQGHSQGVWGVGFVNEATVWSGAADGSLKAWDVRRGTAFSQLAGTSSRIGSGIYPYVVFGADDKTLWRREPGGAIHRWRYHTGETLPPFREEENRRMAFSTDGRFLLLVERETELENRFQVWRLDGAEPILVRERFVPEQTNNRLVDGATISDDGSAVVWVYGTELFRLNLDTGDVVQWTERWPPTFFRMSPDGRFLAVTRQTNNWDLRVWDVGDAPKLHAPVPGIGPIFETEFSPDGSTLALARWRNGAIQLFDVATQETFELRGHAGAVYTIDFSPDGSLLISGGADGILRLWNLKQRSLLAAFSPHDLPIISVTFSQDGHTITSVGEDGETRLWWGGDEQSQDADYWRWIADTHEQRGSREAALAAWSQAIQLSPQPVSSDFLRRANAYCLQGFWEEAAANFGEAYDLIPQDQAQPNPFKYGLILAHLGRVDDYNTICRRYLRSRREARDAHEVIGIAKMCLVADADPEPEILREACRLADLATEAKMQEVSKRPNLGHWYPFALHTKGLVDYRRGNYQTAIDWFQKSAKLFSSRGAAEARVSIHAADLLFSAMAAQHLGNQEDCRRWQAEANELIKTLPEQGTHHDWLVLQIARREAESVLE